jgi:hypothetical protein
MAATGTLIVIYVDDLAAAERRGEESGGKIIRERFRFAGDHGFILVIRAGMCWRLGVRNNAGACRSGVDTASVGVLWVRNTRASKNDGAWWRLHRGGKMPAARGARYIKADCGR